MSILKYLSGAEGRFQTDLENHDDYISFWILTFKTMDPGTGADRCSNPVYAEAAPDQVRNADAADTERVYRSYMNTVTIFFR